MQNIKLKILVEFVKDGEYIVAYCPSLKLSSFGKDIIEAQRMFNEALSVFLKDTISKGTLPEILEGLGWQKRDHKLVPPIKIDDQIENASILDYIEDEVLVPSVSA